MIFIELIPPRQLLYWKKVVVWENSFRDRGGGGLLKENEDRGQKSWWGAGGGGINFKRYGMNFKLVRLDPC